jgi:hypothetical protein
MRTVARAAGPLYVTFSQFRCMLFKWQAEARKSPAHHRKPLVAPVLPALLAPLRNWQALLALVVANAFEELKLSVSR